MTIEKRGLFFPSRLATELRTAGLDVAGVTCSEDEAGNVLAVQIICADGSDTALVDSVCEAHVPTQAIATTAGRPPAADAVLGALAALDPKTATVSDVVTAVKDALEHAGATPK